MRWSEIEAMVFDCYGTLIDWERGLEGELRPWLERGGVEASADEILERFAVVEARLEAERPGMLYPELLAEAHRRLALDWGLEPDPRAARAFGESVGSWPPFEDSRESLARLAGRYRLAVLSNVDRRSFEGSSAALGRPFELVVTAEEVGVYKPDRRGFGVILGRLEEAGVPARGVLHVAQSLFHDIVPASELGLATCWIDRRGGREGFGATPPPGGEVVADVRFTSLAELADAALAR